MMNLPLWRTRKALCCGRRLRKTRCSTSAELANDLCPALPHGPAAFSNQPSLGAVARQHFGLGLGDVRKPAFESFGNASMKGASRLAQQHAVGSVLH